MEVAQLWPLSCSIRAKWRRCQNIASEMTIHLASPKSWHGRQAESRNLLIPTLQMKGLSWQQTAAQHAAHPKDILALPPYYHQSPTQIARDDTESRRPKSRGIRVITCQDSKHNFKTGFAFVLIKLHQLFAVMLHLEFLNFGIWQLIRILIHTHVMLQSTENKSLVKNTKISQANYESSERKLGRNKDRQP